VDSLSISNIQIKQLYIKWDEKIDVSIEELVITENTKKDNTPLDYKEINNALKKLSLTRDWFNSIAIENITYNDIFASFKYRNGEKGFFLASSDDLDIDIALTLYQDILQASIKKFKDTKREIYAEGDLYFDADELEFYTSLNIKIKDEIDVTLFGLLNPDATFYKLISNKQIKDYKHTINLAHIPKAVMFWAYDALDMSDIDLINASGYIDHNNIEDAYKNIHIKADVNNLHYTYNTELDAIHTARTELEFKDGILFIRPKKASSYNMALGSSWLKVDFTTEKEELLTLHLLFNAKLNKDILRILSAYEINLPFLQNSGSVKTNLTIKVGLQTIDIDANGEFFTEEANFDYLGLNIDIYNATIKLNNYDVSIDNMFAKYKKMAAANVNVRYDAAKSKGVIDFDFKSLNLEDIEYDFKEKPFLARYTISPDGDLISAKESQWIYKKEIINIDELTMPFNLDTLVVEIPTTLVTLKDIGTAFIEGSVDINKTSTALIVDVLKFSYDGVELTQSSTPLKVIYDKDLTVSSENEIFFSLSGSIYKIKNFSVKVDDENIKINHTKLEIGKYIDTKVYAKYNRKTQKAHISLSGFTLTDPNTNKTIYQNNKILISASLLGDAIKMKSKELDATFISQDTGWRLYLNSLGRIAKSSEFLKRYQAEKGTFTLYKNKDDKYTRFKATLIHPYKILVENNKPINKYKIKGKIYHEKVYLDINDKIKIVIKDDIKVKLNNCAINLMATIDAYKDISEHSTSEKNLNLFLTAKNSYLYISETRKVLYETLDIQFYHNILSAQLHYKSGDAGLRYEKSKFHLYGKKFNDNFMYELFALSKFKNGSLDFSMSGDISDYKGVVYVRKTTIKDYKILNNILAFINTVPSLMTFNLPGYSKDGLYINRSYLNFTFKNDTFDFTNIYLDSKEMDIIGKGTANIKRNDLNVTLNLKTDLGSEISKIPLVGYIFLDDETLSTSLSIKGKVDNPQVSSLIATDIAVAPFNIIKRTLTLPYKLIKDATRKKENIKSGE